MPSSVLQFLVDENSEESFLISNIKFIISEEFSIQATMLKFYHHLHELYQARVSDFKYFVSQIMIRHPYKALPAETSFLEKSDLVISLWDIPYFIHNKLDSKYDFIDK